MFISQPSKWDPVMPSDRPKVTQLINRRARLLPLTQLLSCYICSESPECPARERDWSPIKREQERAIHFQTLAFNSQAGHLTPCPTQVPKGHPGPSTLPIQAWAQLNTNKELLPNKLATGKSNQAICCLLPSATV